MQRDRDKSLAKGLEGDKMLTQPMLTVREVASFLHIHANTVRRWAKRGVLKSYSVGPQHSLRFNQQDILAFLERSENGVRD